MALHPRGELDAMYLNLLPFLTRLQTLKVNFMMTFYEHADKKNKLKEQAYIKLFLTFL